MSVLQRLASGEARLADTGIAVSIVSFGSSQGSAVKGLDVAQDFFLNWGMSALKQHSPDLLTRISARCFVGTAAAEQDKEHIRTPHALLEYAL